MSYATFVLGDASASRAGLVCLGGLGGFLLWAGLVPLAEGVAAPGQIVAEDNRKVVQHLEGGILRRLYVREGATVRRGSVLLELDDVQARSTRDQLALTVATLRAARDRLSALAALSPLLRFAPVDALAVPPAALAQIHAQQRALFAQQRGALGADISVLGARGRSLAADATGKGRQIATVRQSLALVRTNLAERRRMLADKLIRRDAVDELEREEQRLETDLARLATERSASFGQSGEVRQQSAKSQADFLEQISTDLTAARTELATAEEKLRAAEDVLARTVIRAPRGGKVLNLGLTTLGGVVRPGDPILEIVPGSARLIAQVQVRPNARDAVHVGQAVVARLNINKSWDAPQLTGEVVDVSGDLKTIRETGASYYEARLVLLAPPELRRQVAISPGMPLEASINSGVKRTFLSYLLEPIRMVVIRGLG
jgi:HlyD family type I secretion membrane fusion protein